MVINELLAIVNNKIYVIDEERYFPRICLSAFSESDIVVAKNLIQFLQQYLRKSGREAESRCVTSMMLFVFKTQGGSSKRNIDLCRAGSSQITSSSVRSR